MPKHHFYASLLLQVFAGIVFIFHSLFKFDWGTQPLAEWLTAEGIPFPALTAYILPWIELIGGLLLVVGLGTRVVSVAFALLMTVVLFQVKLGVGFIRNDATGYEFDLLLLLVMVFLAVAGEGVLDRMLKRRKPETTIQA
jgi:uncharacterized membrane protein YphA (DoxX/SURF4 family)